MPDGSEGWLFTWNGDTSLFDSASAAALHPSGDLLVGGRTETDDDGSDALLMRLDSSDGSLRWTQASHGEALGGDDRISGLVVDLNGDIVATGAVSTEVGSDVWVRKFEAEGGSELWTHTWDGGGSADDEGMGVVSGSDGRLFVAADAIDENDDVSLQIRVLTPEGDELETRRLGAWHPESLAIDSDDALVVAGWEEAFSPDIAIAKYDPAFET